MCTRRAPTSEVGPALGEARAQDEHDVGSNSGRPEIARSPNARRQPRRPRRSPPTSPFSIADGPACGLPRECPSEPRRPRAHKHPGSVGKPGDSAGSRSLVRAPDRDPIDADLAAAERDQAQPPSFRFGHLALNTVTRERRFSVFDRSMTLRRWPLTSTASLPQAEQRPASTLTLLARPSRKLTDAPGASPAARDAPSTPCRGPSSTSHPCVGPSRRRAASRNAFSTTPTGCRRRRPP